MLYDNLNVNEKGHLSFAGYDTAELAEKYGTPLYLMDEDGNTNRRLSGIFPQALCRNLQAKRFAASRSTA